LSLTVKQAQQEVLSILTRHWMNKGKYICSYHPYLEASSFSFSIGIYHAAVAKGLLMWYC